MRTDIRRRLSNLEGNVSGEGVGRLLDLIARDERGESIDWSAVRVEPRLAALVDSLCD